MSNVSSTTVIFTLLGLRGTKLVFSRDSDRKLTFKKNKPFHPTAEFNPEFQLNGKMVKMEHEKIYVERQETLLMTQVAVSGFSNRMLPAGWQFEKDLSVLHTKDIHIDVSKEEVHR